MVDDDDDEEEEEDSSEVDIISSGGIGAVLRRMHPPGSAEASTGSQHDTKSSNDTETLVTFGKRVCIWDFFCVVDAKCFFSK